MKSPIQPLDGWVLVIPIDQDEVKTDAGLILKTTEKEKDQRKNLAQVIDTPKKCPVSKGCTIYHKPYAGQDAWVNEKRYVLIEYQDICGVLKE
jgi:co-chaperonin GroES (HSP10)